MQQDRREFLKSAAALAVASLTARGGAADKVADRPNILWITSEDNSPFLGCYGDKLARTPNMDAMAKQGIVFEHAYASAPICAPNRSTLITGCYACSLGTQPMRSGNAIPDTVRAYSEYLREAGYYCTNNSKTDYNTRIPKSAWDECSNKAHYKNRKAGQPFFAIFNLTVSHESSTHRTPDSTVTDPDKIVLPPHHVDTPVMRRQWALYYDAVEKLDTQVGQRLRELEEAGLADDTIVFYYSDHGGVMPWSKRFLHERGTHIPLIVRFPKKYQHLAPSAPGTRSDRLVSFVDLSPTLLSLAGVSVPANMQGEAFMGPQAKAPRQYVYLFRDRADERPDAFRAVRDQRYRYIRNYYPHLPYGQHLNYLWKNPAMPDWEAQFRAGKCNAAQSAFFLPRAQEELYDLQADPYEVKNLAADPACQDTLQRMRKALRDWQLDIRDTCLLSEAEMMRRAEGSTIFEMMRSKNAPNLERLMEASDLAGQRKADNLPKLVALLKDADSGVRYWGAVGLWALGEKAAPAAGELRAALKDDNPSVRVAAATALLCGLKQPQGALDTLKASLSDPNEMVRLAAINALDNADDALIQPVMEAVAQLKQGYPARVAEFMLGKTEQKRPRTKKK
ncbi:MAG: Arylsulfatase [Planctomycetes bacterium ADurb.Bin126]|nr:MAG: Arylsulfatase [Planctomycetes bacterium ADurb.Bin126]HOD84272.1 sulfatase-like hydrolase/transferase [Phycisphaerae bacterium]HQL74291.1 sulfatase-like hydrolase/transferase [Phycisphaerae bacterium]